MASYDDLPLLDSYDEISVTWRAHEAPAPLFNHSARARRPNGAPQSPGAHEAPAALFNHSARARRPNGAPQSPGAHEALAALFTHPAGA